jgi:sec-independent protein translocase protein TatC
MAEVEEEIRPEDEEVEGGAVKSFLEHLEDLRWVLIKSSVALVVAMMLCLYGTKQLMAFLQWPIDRAQNRHIMLLPDDTNQTVTIQLAGITLKSLQVESNKLGPIDLGTNPFVTLKLDPVTVGTNVLLGVSVATNAAPPLATTLKLSFTGAAEPFIFALHLAFYAGLILASPFILYFVGEFVMPALKIREKKYFLRGFYFGTFLFLSGVSFAYFWVAPAAIKFAIVYAQWMKADVPFLLATDYTSFLFKLMLGMGAGFELPVVLLALVKIGVLDYAKLTAMRRYMIIINLVLGAILTTQEVLTQIIMAVVLQVLFEVAVWIAWYWERQEKKRALVSGG